MRTVTVSEFRRNASGILHLVEKGERVTILRYGKVIASIVPPERREAVPAWRRRGLRLVVSGASLSRVLLEERRSRR